ncbi:MULTISPECIES: STAS domain-containing protein [unclassified Streptosporangium]|uniref:STAS domain-containing protein n=1 Tax=unclassified Streptosporangium TaxID=2632669 RepID=UPI002E2E14B8|nr:MULTISPECIES: STAS domain-containing protein [unclassified Streptosporangium]
MANMDMSVYVIHQYGDTALVAVMGELDAFNYRLLESELESLMLGGTRHILVDAGELLFCDVSGARALERIHEGLRAAGGELFVVPSPTVIRLFNVLWGAQGPEHPGLVDISSLDEFPEASPLPRRHVPVLRRIGGRRRAHRDVAPRTGILASETSSPPERTTSAESTRSTTALPDPRGVPGGTTPPAGREAAHPPAERAAHPVLERAAHLRREAAARLEMLRLQTQTTCATLAEIHDRMAALQAGLETHIAMRAAVRRACDEHFHRADRMRELATSFPAGSG